MFYCCSLFYSAEFRNPSPSPTTKKKTRPALQKGTESPLSSSSSSSSISTAPSSPPAMSLLAPAAPLQQSPSSPNNNNTSLPVPSLEHFYSALDVLEKAYNKLSSAEKNSVLSLLVTRPIYNDATLYLVKTVPSPISLGNVRNVCVYFWLIILARVDTFDDTLTPFRPISDEIKPLSSADSLFIAQNSRSGYE